MRSVTKAERTPPQTLKTVKETAEILRCSTRTVWRLISLRAIRPVRLGRAVRIDPKSVEALIERGGVK